MRGTPDPQLAMLTSVSTEDLIPAEHPIRKIRVVVDAVLAELDPIFDEMYATSGRRSVPPEMLLKSTVLIAMYSIRSERAFCERLNYDLLFKWFLDMRIDQPAFDATTFTKNRKRLLDHDVADEFFAAVVRQAKLRRYLSSDHFSVDGTPLNAWASHKSFKPKDGPPSEPPIGCPTIRVTGFDGDQSACSMSPSGVTAAAPGRSSTAATGTWPGRRSGTPITHARGRSGATRSRHGRRSRRP
ncbi:MAG TPA: transposase [Ilumatobacter sp.]|nr:transposase [Ilumatobacter sp.]